MTPRFRSNQGCFKMSTEIEASPWALIALDIPALPA